ncbi:Lin0512 family protein [Halomonas sp. M20]|uniref:Lin0512 family protein n=1 Tax=Halomonas sp. M20 TaxID=2763264 RepID=UPI001D0AE6FA|nr:Lin0512 family protein [Halomonas sp. M20]
MTKKRVVTEFGMGTSLRREDYTEAAARAIRDALWHNSLNVAELFDFPKTAMIIDVEVGVQKPDAVDKQALLALFPYGQPAVEVVQGGLNVPKPDGSGVTVIANAALKVSFDMEPTHG